MRVPCSTYFIIICHLRRVCRFLFDCSLRVLYTYLSLTVVNYIVTSIKRGAGNNFNYTSMHSQVDGVFVCRGLAYTGIAFLLLGVVLLIIGVIIAVVACMLYRRFTGRVNAKKVTRT